MLTYADVCIRMLTYAVAYFPTATECVRYTLARAHRVTALLHALLPYCMFYCFTQHLPDPLVLYPPTAAECVSIRSLALSIRQHTYADVCSYVSIRMLTYADVCWPMSV
jgi:hypothetical protein